jgi:PST family polysaccharide transporter
MPDHPAAKRLLRNLASTTVFQASGYLLAMINVPYLTRTLGVSDYGILAFVISINAYLFLIIDWGFSLGSTRDIAQARGDGGAIRRIFWQTMTAKGLLSALAAAVLFGVIALHRVPSPLYLVLPGMMNIFAAVFSVDWLVQGLERMGLFTLYSVAGRTLVVVLTFIPGWPVRCRGSAPWPAVWPVSSSPAASSRWDARSFRGGRPPCRSSNTATTSCRRVAGWPIPPRRRCS